MPEVASGNGLRHALSRSAWQEIAALRHRVSPLPERFILLAQERSGSTRLARMIGAHSMIRCDGDLLGSRRLAPVPFAENRARAAGTPWYGFRASPAHLAARQGRGELAVLLARFHARGWRILHLSRENLLDQAIESLLGRGSARSRVRIADCGAELRHPLDPTGVLARLREIAASLATERAALRGLDHLSLRYERDLLGGTARAAALGRIWDFLGAPHEYAATDLRHALQRPLSTLVANYDEIAAAIASTPFAIYLPSALALPLAISSGARAGER